MDFIYTLFENYGIWILIIVVFSAQLGIPIGSMFFLMWYGSTRDTTTAVLIAIPITASAAVMGDMSAYLLGRRFTQQLDNAEKKYSWFADKSAQSQKLINTYGNRIIWLTRFLATGMGPIVNYLLGSKTYPIKQFLAWVILGEIIFTAELLYFGYRFKQTWEDLLTVISDAGWLIALIIISAWLLKRLLKRKKAASTIKAQP